MASETHTEDPRTGCWTPAEGHSVESVFELYRGEPPHGSELTQLCPTDGCANPEHLRPTFHVTAELDDLEVLAQANPSLGHPVSSETIAAALELGAQAVEPTPEPAPVPQAPVKRGPGRPRKQR